jgi:hypothetical protein
MWSRHSRRIEPIKRSACRVILACKPSIPVPHNRVDWQQSGSSPASLAVVLRIRDRFEMTACLARSLSPLRSTTHSFEPLDFLETVKWPAIGGLRRWRFGLCRDRYWHGGYFGRVVSGASNPVSRNRRPSRAETRFECGLKRIQPKNLPLAKPFGRQVAEARHPHPVWKSPIDCGPDEIGCEEGEGDCHVDLPHAAALTSGDAFGCRPGSGHEFAEPAASTRNRRNQQRAVLGANRAGIIGSSVLRYEDFTAASR